MNWQNAALAMAGVIGSGVAVVHGNFGVMRGIEPACPEQFPFSTDNRATWTINVFC